METEVITNLFVGDLADACRGFDGIVICVLEDRPEQEPIHALWLPFLENGRATLDSTALIIERALELGARVLVHCEEGCERAPLVVAYFLRSRRAMSWDEAYALLRARRPVVQDRRRWLGPLSLR